VGPRIAAPLPIMAGLLVVIVIAWFAFPLLSARLGRQSCTNPATIEVAAEPAIAPALAEVATVSAAQDERLTNAPDTCYQLQVLSQESNSVANRLTGAQPGGQPDVWVPDSTFWLRRARAGGAIDLPEAGASLATSPVVMAVTEPAARRLGWPERALGWPDVLGATPTASALTVGLPDPARNPVGLSTLFGVRAMASGGPAPGAAQIAALRRLSPNVTVSAAELFEKLPPADNPGAPDTGPDTAAAFPTSEQALLRHNSTDRKHQRLVPVYAPPGVPSLDYPYVVLPTTSGIERAGAQRFLESLLDRASQRILQARGLRTPQGAAAAGLPGGDFLGSKIDRPAMVPVVPLPDQDSTDDVQRVWTGVNLSARVLTVIDVSGSMGARVPGTDLSRAHVTAEAAKLAFTLYKPTTDMGLWAFSNNLDGDRDYRELAPIAPMATERQHLIELTDQVVTMVGGKTNLYDTSLAAYQTVLQGWDAARLNVVVVLTDGRDDDVSSITRQQLVDELARLQDPRKPTRLIFVGIGPDVDAAELDQIATVTGGRAFTTPNPAGIRDVFAQALAELTCVPPECTKPR
jgi:hypothetical protein